MEEAGERGGPWPDRLGAASRVQRLSCRHTFTAAVPESTTKTLLNEYDAAPPHTQRTLGASCFRGHERGLTAVSRERTCHQDHGRHSRGQREGVGLHNRRSSCQPAIDASVVVPTARNDCRRRQDSSRGTQPASSSPRHLKLLRPPHHPAQRQQPRRHLRSRGASRSVASEAVWRRNAPPRRTSTQCRASALALQRAGQRWSG